LCNHGFQFHHGRRGILGDFPQFFLRVLPLIPFEPKQDCKNRRGQSAGILDVSVIVDRSERRTIRASSI
jgi:hypothetical protein